MNLPFEVASVVAAEEADGSHGEDGEDLHEQIAGQVRCCDCCGLTGILGCVHQEDGWWPPVAERPSGREGMLAIQGRGGSQTATAGGPGRPRRSESPRGIGIGHRLRAIA